MENVSVSLNLFAKVVEIWRMFRRYSERTRPTKVRPRTRISSESVAGQKDANRPERGATAVEYALMVGLVAIGIISAVSFLGTKAKTATFNAGAYLGGAGRLRAVKPTVAASSSVNVVITEAASGSMVRIVIGGANCMSDPTKCGPWAFVTSSATAAAPVTVAVTAPATTGSGQIGILDPGYSSTDGLPNMLQSWVPIQVI